MTGLQLFRSRSHQLRLQAMKNEQPYNAVPSIFRTAVCVEYKNVRDDFGNENTIVQVTEQPCTFKLTPDINASAFSLREQLRRGGMIPQVVQTPEYSLDFNMCTDRFFASLDKMRLDQAMNDLKQQENAD